MKLSVVRDKFAFREAFVISRGAKTAADVITVTLEDQGHKGQGEAVPYAHNGETQASVMAAIETLPAQFTRAELQDLLPAGAARNAVDCALWDLEAKQAGRPVWDLAGLAPPGPEITAYTLSLGTPEAMNRQASQHAFRPLLKVKLGGEGDLERIRAVRAGAPSSRIIVDANEGWDGDSYQQLAPEFRALGVEMVEQPLPAGKDDVLASMDRILPVCADESCHISADLPALKGKYDFVNIKLDKTGGFTEALALKEAAGMAGFGIMVGCMAGSSLAMAPAVLLAQGAGFTDLDGPLLLAEDRLVPLRYDEQGVHVPDPALWG